MTKRGRTASVPPSRNRGAGAPGPIRCAIYTRKSSEEGLELEFNSLDAQREAAEAYIASQRNEGWICLPDRYDVGGTPGCVMRSDILRLEVLARLGGVYLDTDVKPVRPLDEMCPPEVVAWAACEQLDIVTNAAMGFPPNHPAMWHAVAMVEESFFERRYVGDQAGPGLIARVVTQYDDVALYPPAYFHPTVGESKTSPDLKHFLLAAHLFAGTWVEDNRQHYSRMWQANRV